MKSYLMLFKGGLDGEQSPELWQTHMMDWKNWMDDLGKRGKLSGGQQLQKNGRVMTKENNQIIDRPYAEAKEIVGGYLTVKAESQEEAMQLANDCPIFKYDGSCEVAEIIEM